MRELLAKLGNMGKANAISAIERELAGFRPEEQEQLGRQIASYLHKVRTLREALSAGEGDLASGEVKSLVDLDETIAALRRQHAG